jgi:hypothetical protein
MRSILFVLPCLLLAATACSSADTDPGTVTPDTTAPTLALTVGRYDVIRGKRTLTPEAADDTAVAHVELLVDGAPVAESMTAPFAIEWDSVAGADGVHQIHLVAHDAAGNSAQTEDVPVLVVNQGTTPAFDEVPQAVDGLIEKTFKVPITWNGNDELIDLKYHWDMPASMKKVVAVLAWDPAQGFDMDFSTGTGFCPDSGVAKKKAIGASGETVLEYTPTTALPTGQWFAHVGAENAADMKGKSVPFKLRVAYFP